VVIVDNLSNSNVVVLDRIEELTGVRPKFYELDVQDRQKLEVVFEENNIDSVIHFAALKAVGESVEKPLEYYSNNLINTLVLLETMRKYNVKNFVFSSSATVYGDPHACPILENFPLSATNPYGRTKLMIEDMLRDICKADESLNVAILRYFNPVGAHKSGRIGEEPNGIPNNLMPYITKVAIGQLNELSVFGDDYNTPDGTGVRDYIHVVDLSIGHVKALEKLETNSGLVTYNLGTGNGYSVLEMVKAFSKASGKEVAYKIVDRRPGDIAMCYADPAKAEAELGWKAKYDLDEMCEDSWRWQSNNPKGYEM
ncbi:MAG: UDP-glucose 4-epimerase GalE, partial [Paraclostridium sp.]